MSLICDPCRTEQGRWLDTKPSTHVTTGISFQSHAAYDDTASGLHDNSRARHRQWVALVRFQQALIAQICVEERHAARLTALPGQRTDVDITTLIPAVAA